MGERTVQQELYDFWSVANNGVQAVHISPSFHKPKPPPTCNFLISTARSTTISLYRWLKRTTWAAKGLRKQIV